MSTEPPFDKPDCRRNSASETRDKPLYNKEKKPSLYIYYYLLSLLAYRRHLFSCVTPFTNFRVLHSILECWQKANKGPKGILLFIFNAVSVDTCFDVSCRKCCHIFSRKIALNIGQSAPHDPKHCLTMETGQ